MVVEARTVGSYITNRHHHQHRLENHNERPTTRMKKETHRRSAVVALGVTTNMQRRVCHKTMAWLLPVVKIRCRVLENRYRLFQSFDDFMIFDQLLGRTGVIV